MKIGITYDLRADYLAAGYDAEETAEYDSLETIESVESALHELGHRPDRIGHARALVGRLAHGDRWDLVFNFAEGLNGIGREAQVPAILDVYGIPYTFSDPVTLALTLHKGLTKNVLRDRGIATAPFRVAAGPEDLADLALTYPLFVKPVAEGTSKGIDPSSRVADAAALLARATYLWERYAQPVLVEEYLPGREFTVGIVGTGRSARVLGTLEVILLAGAEPGVYSYVNKERCEELVEYRLGSGPLVREAEELALCAWRALDCRDAGRVDVRADADDRPQVIELNPLAGLHPEHSDLPILCNLLGVPYLSLVAEILESARVRAQARQAQVGRIGIPAPA